MMTLRKVMMKMIMVAALLSLSAVLGTLIILTCNISLEEPVLLQLIEFEDYIDRKVKSKLKSLFPS